MLIVLNVNANAISTISNIYEDSSYCIEDKVDIIEEYPEATYVWNYLKNEGYNDYVAAGILGNMMVECGGLTLELQPTIKSNGYYGICQWSLEYYPEIDDTTLKEQCEHLVDSIENVMNLFGADDEYENFLSLTDEKETAVIFAEYYEVCWSGSYEKRKDCATIAYNYFAVDEINN